MKSAPFHVLGADVVAALNLSTPIHGYHAAVLFHDNYGRRYFGSVPVTVDRYIRRREIKVWEAFHNIGADMAVSNLSAPINK